MNTIRKLNNQEIASFCEQTALLFQAGITPAESMDILLHDTSDPSAIAILKEMQKVCNSGNPLSNAMQQVQVFPEYVLHMVRLGEESGNMDDVMQSLSDYYEREEEISESFRSAISYPLIMIAMMLLVIFVLITKVLPVFSQVFSQLGDEMTGFPLTLMTIGLSLRKYAVSLAIVFALLLGFFVYCTHTMKGKILGRRILSAYGPFKSFYENIAAGRFASGMALALSSGMDTYSGLELVADLVENAKTRSRILVCRQKLLSGESFQEALISSGIFSALYARMVSVGFKSGSMDVVLSKIAVSYDKETNARLRRILSVLEPTLVIILSIIVGLILLSVILPLMGIMSSMG